MSNPAIQVTDLSKRYTLGAAEERYRTLRDSIVSAVQAPLKRWRLSRAEDTAASVWALKNVNFEVQPGETLGIIGRNGAGKSTLLKIFSRITEPTSGRVMLNGRVASLLEVGTGFHQELTGRENVYLNGAILGMTHREMDRKFDQIVAFSEVEKFIDTPVKRYSSGMQLRLAFAVAAHLEPEILVIDEVLAVGDSTFQRRCITRMKELAVSGCTLLFVSHNMEMIPTLCRSALWLRSGQVVDHGPAHSITDAYLASVAGEANDDDLQDRARTGDGRARFRSFSLLDSTGNTASSIRYGEDLRCRMEIESCGEWKDISLAVVIKTVNNTRIINSLTDEVGFHFNLVKGKQAVECRIKNVCIRPGRQMVLELWMADGDTMDHVETARIYDVTESRFSGISHRPEHSAYVCAQEWTCV